ncbi:helix-turn-helix transcriptional regulator [Paenibacillus sp. NPDC057934]|uniref:helix-turn-helix transcriptional regulator n=1 Tax=Paenibacillus sp. NPDC057934 TaxID=3346282 RepID=UPI0036DBEB58
MTQVAVYDSILLSTKLKRRVPQGNYELSQGYTNPEIADRLNISLATVKTHIINVYSKLSVSSRVAAVEAVRTRGLLH